MAGFKELQKQVHEFDQEMGWIDKPEHVVMHMQEELGEISREILRGVGYKREEMDSGALGQEIIDLLYLTFKLANHYGIDVDAVWGVMRQRYRKTKG